MLASEVERPACHQRKTVKGKIGATASHSMYLSGGLDNESRCEVGIVTLPDGRVLSGQVAQGL